MFARPMPSPKLLHTLAITLAFSLHAFSAGKGGGFTDPDAAGPDFAMQGKYGGGECGARVIALGGGKVHFGVPACQSAASEFKG